MPEFTASKLTVFLFLVIIVCIANSTGVSAQPVEIKDLINIEELKKNGEVWEIAFQSLEKDNGRFCLHHNKWLMFFLHWRPLDERTRNLSLEYSRKHLLNFWGEAMNFELTGDGGETDINGHRAYYVNGSFGKGAVLTRFIVWNCPQTNRQLTADCNINARLKTPPNLLELEEKVTHTVCCHAGFETKTNPDLPREYHSELAQLSFRLPPVWRTDFYDDQNWFPEGPSLTNGSLWILPANSGKTVELSWKKTGKEITSGMFDEFLKTLIKDTVLNRDTSIISHIELDSLDRDGVMLVGQGKLRQDEYYQGDIYPSNYIFRAYLWRDGDTVYFLLAALIKIDQFWQRKVALDPTGEVFNNFVDSEIIPNVLTFKRQ